MSRKGSPFGRPAAFALLLLGPIFPARAQNGPSSVPAQAGPEIEDHDTSPLHQALLDYKTGHYDQARVAIEAAEKARPGDPPTEILKSRILTELGDYANGEKALRSVLGPTGPVEVQVALGDLLLRKRSFDRAAKFYDLALQAKPDDPDLLLKLVYTRIGVSDLVGAGQYASRLKPLDPKNPYDDHASYYFAKAALAQATGNGQEADSEIQLARTLYGITVSNRYLKTYLEVTNPNGKSPASDITPPPLVKPVPTGAKT